MTAALLILFLGACAGNAALLAFSLNYWYGTALPHKLLHQFRHGHALLGVGVPVAFWLTFGLDLTAIRNVEPALSWQTALAAYALLCWLLTFGLLPLITLTRLLRRPAGVLANHTRTVDVAEELGYVPAGHGTHARLARLPGNQVFCVEFSKRELALPRLPEEWDGLSVLHLSDLHFNGTPDREFYQYVVDVCRDWEPDLVALTGDVVDSDKHHRWVLPVLGRLRWRLAAFAILGNHDSWYDPNLTRRRLRRLGMDVLGNTWTQLEVRGRPLVVIGHEGPWFRPIPDLAGCPADVFRLCLSHTPDNIRWARRHRIDLMLSGHNHGGQIRFPVIGPILVPSRYSRRYDCGTFVEPPTLLHVSRGLGAQHPIRYNCRPEVTRLILRQESGGGVSDS